MADQTVTRAAESDLEPGIIYRVLSQADNLPQWAPVFADAVERIDDTHYWVTKTGASFDVELTLHPSAGTVDFIREMAQGKRGGAYIRVIPRPLGGSTIVMTVPIAPNAALADVAKVVDQELEQLIRLAKA